MSAITIRGWRPGDTDGVCAVVREVYIEYGWTWDPEGYHYDLTHLEEVFSAEGMYFWVAEQDGSIVGCGGLELYERPIQGPLGQLIALDPLVRIGGADCEVVRLYVRPSARRQGIASRLMALVLDQARLAGRTQMEIWSDLKLKDAHRLYQNMGARLIGDRKLNDPDNSTEHGLLLALD